MCPGLKDSIVVKEDGIKRTIQKHYLLTTLKEAHATYYEENPEHHVGFSML
jgi:hypothetical protein